MPMFAAQPGWYVSFLDSQGKLTRAAAIAGWYEIPPHPHGLIGVPFHPSLEGLPPSCAIPLVIEHRSRALIPANFALAQNETNWSIRPPDWTPESDEDQVIPPPAHTFEASTSNAAMAAATFAAMAAAAAASITPTED
jgi:hypothetical protein